MTYTYIINLRVGEFSAFHFILDSANERFIIQIETASASNTRNVTIDNVAITVELYHNFDIFKRILCCLIDCITESLHHGITKSLHN